MKYEYLKKPILNRLYTKDRNDTYKLITGKKLTNLMRNESVDEMTSLWKECKISNYEYIMQLNPQKFEIIPEYVIDECNKLLAKE